MAQTFRSQGSGTARQTPVNVAALALRGIGQVYDMNVAATRVLLQTQARAASALGWPDFTGLFGTVDERARHVFAAGAEQFVSNAQRANEAALELQREVGRVVDTQTATVADTFQQGLEELSTQAAEGLQQLVETARQQAEEAERVAAAIGQEMREAIREGGEEVRGNLQRGRELASQAAGQAEQAAEEARAVHHEERGKRRAA